MSDPHDPFASPSPAPSYSSGPFGDDSDGDGVLTAVAVVNYLFGGMQVLCGLCMSALGGSFFGVMGIAAEQNGQLDPEARVGFGIATGFVIVIGIIVALMGLPSILAGYGVQKRAQWGRILTIVLGVLAALSALAQLFSLSPLGLIHLGYAIFVLVVLFNPKYADRFR